MNKHIIASGILLCALATGARLFGAASSSSGSAVYFLNDTSYTLDVSTPKKQHSKVVPQERVFLGGVNDIGGDITYYTYGQWLSVGARTYSVSLNDIKKMHTKAGSGNILIRIYTNYYGLYASEISVEENARAQQAMLPGNAASPESYFPHAKTALGQVAWKNWTFDDLVKFKPHFILGLPPEASTDDVKEAAQQLKDKIKTIKNQGLSNELINIVNQATNNMLRHSLYTPTQMADFGRQIYWALENGDASYFASIKQHFASKFNQEQAEGAMLEALVLYFYYIAHKLGHVFQEGTFVIYDQGGRLYAFLDRLNKKYARNASHFNGLAAIENKPWLAISGSGHRGYDLDIPAIQKRTLLFNKLDSDGSIFFLKPETHGTDKLTDLIGHAASFVHAQGRKTLPSLFGSDDAQEYSKERVPKAILEQYLAAIEALPETESEKNRLSKLAVARGIQLMYKESKRLAANYPASAALKSFIQLLETKERAGDPKFTHLDKRFGAEVILTPEEFNKFKAPISPSETFGV